MTPRVTYLTVDSLMEGVGVSQVLPYVERLPSRGVQVEVHSFERFAPDPTLTSRLVSRGVTWRPHAFGRTGSIGGLVRVLAGALSVRGDDLVHARSDLAAASTIIARCGQWVWDVRSFWTDQRIALGMLRPGSPEERVMRGVERRAATSCSAVVTLARAAIPVMIQRHGHLANRTLVVPTCVDLHHFHPTPEPAAKPLRLLLSGTLNEYYDVPAMIRLAEVMSRRTRVELHVLAPGATPWDDSLFRAGALRATASHEEMVPWIERSHAGLSVCRLDAGVSLRAAMPTKLAEFLACGRPVVVNRGLGDMDELLARYQCGVVVDDTSDEGLLSAADRLEGLLGDPELSSRCRTLAEDHFDLDKGVDALADLYCSLAGS